MSFVTVYTTREVDGRLLMPIVWNQKVHFCWVKTLSWLVKFLGHFQRNMVKCNTHDFNEEPLAELVSLAMNQAMLGKFSFS